jgi:lysophospholipid acyltransferase (LPLAT)-like uncharacterized protein
MSHESSGVLTRGQYRKAAAISALGAPIVRALGATYRWRIEGIHHYDAIVASGKQPIFAFWHGRILPATLYWKNRGIVVITSQNFDGEWIAGIIERFGYGTARGSTSRGGVRALVQLRKALSSGRPAAFTVDGPRGPARVAQAGAVFLAGATGHPILPFHIEADRFWSMKSWDRTQVPKPRSRLSVAIGPPIDVPNTLDAIVEDKRQELERTLYALEARATSMSHEP